MTSDPEVMSLNAIELCRDFNRRMAARQALNGIPPAEIAIGAIYSAIDVAQGFQGSLPAAIGWARQALDVMEDNLRLLADEPGKTVQ